MRKCLWDGRISDLEPGDVIIATCDRCGHMAYIPQEVIQAKVTGDYNRPTSIHHFSFVKELPRRLRCTRCPVPLNARPHREISIRVGNEGDRIRRKTRG